MKPDLVNLFGPLDGEQIPGGCDECDSYQTVRAHEHDIWIVTVHHDDDCPVWLAIKARR